MKIFLKFLLLLSIIILINAKLHRVTIHRQEGAFKTIENIIAEEKYVTFKQNSKLNDNLVPQSVDTLNATFYSYIFIGTPPQQVEVAFDTSLYVLGIPTQEYNYSLSSTSKKGDDYYELHFPMGYDYYVWAINDETDNVQVSDAIITGQVMFPLFSKRGLFGLGTQPPLGTPFPSFLENFYNQTQQSEHVFSMYLVTESKNSIPQFGGELIIGGSDPSLYIGELTYVDVDTNVAYNWAIKIDAVTVMGENISQNVGALIDSATDFIGCPLLQYALINEKLNGTMDGYGHFIIDCDIIDTLPNVELTIGGQIVTLVPTKYILKVIGANEQIECMSPFFYTYADYFILGTTFMTEQYLEFDSTNNRIGFAPVAPYNGSTNVIPIMPVKQPSKSVCRRSKK